MTVIAVSGPVSAIEPTEVPESDATAVAVDAGGAIVTVGGDV